MAQLKPCLRPYLAEPQLTRARHDMDSRADTIQPRDPRPRIRSPNLRPTTLPVLGNLHQLFGSLPHRSLRDLANKHGPLMHLGHGQLFTIVVSSAGVAKELLKTHDLNFADRLQILIAKIYGATVSFFFYGDHWRQLRKIYMHELLSTKRVESFQCIREEEVLNQICIRGC
ncbi:Cytochrome P450 [Cinnamomum micranthum f. kanehirae]|uniref:Cytochrome P450 n=1 Tax=Cinnamomum micranthum f. kanehirae TaxID=337451 RepID=A0A443N614_9MAGN|nr:Cytochrome P450 [Cinnamomum micranthum f. kanehirae]